MPQRKHVPNIPLINLWWGKNITTTYKPFSIAVLCVCKCATTVFRKSIGFTNVLNLLVHEVSHATSNSGSLIKTQATYIWYGLSSTASPLNCRLPIRSGRQDGLGPRCENAAFRIASGSCPSSLVPALVPGVRKWCITIRVVSEWPLNQWSAAYSSEKLRALYKFKVYTEQFEIHRNTHTKTGMQSMPILKQPVLLVSSWGNCYVLNAVLGRVNVRGPLLLSLSTAYWLKYK